MKKILLMVLMVAVFAGCKKMEGESQGQQYGGGQPNPVQIAEKINMLKEFLKSNPKEVKGWIELGNMQMDTSQFAGAVEAYTKALELDPKNIDVVVDRGTCYRGIGKSDIAVQEYKKAIKMNPNHAYAHKNLGVVLAFDMKDKAGAIKAFEAYMKLEPNSPDVSQVKQVIADLKAGKI